MAAQAAQQAAVAQAAAVRQAQQQVQAAAAVQHQLVAAAMNSAFPSSATSSASATPTQPAPCNVTAGLANGGTAQLSMAAALTSAAAKFSEKRKIIEELALADVKKVRTDFIILWHCASIFEIMCFKYYQYRRM